MYKLKLKSGDSARGEIDLTDRWAKIEVIKSDDLYAPDFYISFMTEEEAFLSKAFTQSTSLEFTIESNFANSTAEVKNYSLLITNVATSQLGKTGVMGDGKTLKTVVSVNAIPMAAQKSRDIVGLSFQEEVDSKTVLNAVMNGVPIKTTAGTHYKLVSDSIPQLFIPNSFRLEAFSYLCNTIGIFESPVYYIHEDDGVYIYTLNESLSQQDRYKVLYGTSASNLKNSSATTMVTSRVLTAPNNHGTQYALPKTIDVQSYTPSEFITSTKINLSNVGTPTLGTLTPLATPVTRVADAFQLQTNGSSSARARLAYELLGSLTLTTVIDDWNKFLTLRPGQAVDFESSLDIHRNLDGTYILKRLQLILERKGQEVITDMVLILQRYATI